MIVWLPFAVSLLLLPSTAGERWFSIRMLHAGHKILLPFNDHLEGEGFQLSKALLDSCRQRAVTPGLLPRVTVW